MTLFFRRALAYLMDIAVIYASCVLTSAVFILAYLSFRFSGDPEMIRHLMDRDAFRTFILANNLWMFFSYFTICHWYWGKTLGKKLLSLEVRGESGEEISFQGSLARTLGYLISGQITFGLGFLLAGLRKDQRSLHDLLMKTKVVLAQNSAAPSLLLKENAVKQTGVSADEKNAA
jgi:uncharacterized RDD family membrane protein YckC